MCCLFPCEVLVNRSSFPGFPLEALSQWHVNRFQPLPLRRRSSVTRSLVRVEAARVGRAHHEDAEEVPGVSASGASSADLGRRLGRFGVVATDFGMVKGGAWCLRGWRWGFDLVRIRVSRWVTGCGWGWVYGAWGAKRMAGRETKESDAPEMRHSLKEP